MDAMSLLVRINLVLGVVSAGAAELDAESDRCAFAQRCKLLPST
jgi:hypothetical protein